MGQLLLHVGAIRIGVATIVEMLRGIPDVFRTCFPSNLYVYTSPLNLQPSLLLFACRLTAGGHKRAGVLPSVQTECPSDA